MQLSDILKQMGLETVCQIQNEVSFSTLALTASEIKEASCVFLDNEKYLKDLKPNVKMVITKKELANKIVAEDRGVCVNDSPRLLFFRIHNFLQNNEEYVIESFETKISKSSNVSPLAYIAQNNVIIGEHVIIEPFVTIYPNVTIGEGTIIRSGAKIGGEGFEFKREEGQILSVKHLGSVEIGRFVEIQNNTCVDKAVYPWDKTIIGDYSKIDNLVHVGHAVKIKENVMIVANSGVGGRTVIHPDTWIGFGTTIINGIEIGKEARANIGAVVTKSIPDHGSVTGNFAIDHKKFIENLKKGV